jgi:hypothetical protein
MMNRYRRNRRCRGTSTMEFVLLLPAIVFAMMFILGLARTLVLRQHGLVAARYAAFYERVSGHTPSSTQLRDAITTQWTIIPTKANAGPDLLKNLAGSDEVAKRFGSLVMGLGRSSEIRCAAGHRVEQGLVKATLNLTDVKVEYRLPTGSWTSNECGGFMPLLLDELGRVFRVFI